MWPPANSYNGGTSILQRSRARGQRVWKTQPEGDDTETLLHRALEHDVAFVPGTTFYSGTPDRRTLRLAFTASTPDELREGARRLAAACRT